MKSLAKSNSFAKTLGKMAVFILIVITATFDAAAHAAPIDLEGEPRLQIVKSADKQVVNPSERVSVQTRINNTGTFQFAGVVVDQLSGVEQGFFSVNKLHSSSGLVAYDSVMQQVKWTGSLAAGESVMVSYDVEAGYGAGDGDRIVSSVVTPPETEVECFDCILAVEVAAPMLRISVTADRKVAAPGQTIYYTAIIQNVGRQDYTQDIYSKLNRTASMANCSDCLWEVPGHYNSDVRASLLGEVYYGGNYFWWWGNIPAGQTLTLRYSAQVNDQVLDQDRLVTAVSSTCCIDASAVSNVAVVDIIVPQKPDLYFEMVADKQTASGGDRVSYKVSVRNVSRKNYRGTVFIDLAGVLDKSSYNHDAFSSDDGIFSFDAYNGLRWQGTILAGRTVVLNYSVSVQSTAVVGSRMVSTVKPPEGAGVSGALPTNVVTIAPPDNGNGGLPGQCRTTTRVIIEWPFKLVWERITICDGKVVSIER